MNSVELGAHGLRHATGSRNPDRATLHRHAREPGSAVADSGSPIALSGERTGGSPGDKRIVDRPEPHAEFGGGAGNIAPGPDSCDRLRGHATVQLDALDRVYVVDG